jgi:2-dehydro-3-deoxygluconokinase
MIELRTVAPELMHQSFSGDTLNTAVYLARLAGSAYRVSYATAIGESDPFSNAMLASWEAEGIDTDFVRRRPSELPGIYTIQVDETGERFFSYWRDRSAARNYFEGAPSPLETRLNDVDVLHIWGISLAILPQAGRQRLFAAMEQLRRRGATIVFDNNYRPRLWSSPKEACAAYETAYSLADIALVTLFDECEVRRFRDEAQMIERVASYPCREVVIKHGARPTEVRSEDGSRLTVDVEHIAKVVDTTAAGDSFAAGYLAARLHGRAPAVAARAGNRLAATVIQHPGAIIPISEMPAGLLA